MKKTLSASNFITKFYPDLDSTFIGGKSSVQMFSLQEWMPFLKLPIELIKLDYYFFLYIKTGFIHQQIGIEKHFINGPALIFINAGSLISILEINPDLKGFFIVIDDFLMSEILMSEKFLELLDIRPFICLNDQDADWFASLGEVLNSEMKNHKFHPDILHRLLQALFYKTIQLSNEKIIRSRTENIATDFKKLVHKYSVTEKSTSFYAKKLSISDNYLNKCAKLTFEKSAKEIIIEIVILQAQIKLWDASKSISQICYELNFNDPSYFTRIFKKTTGKTPRAYQKYIFEKLNKK